MSFLSILECAQGREVWQTVWTSLSHHSPQPQPQEPSAISDFNLRSAALLMVFSLAWPGAWVVNAKKSNTANLVPTPLKQPKMTKTFTIRIRTL